MVEHAEFQFELCVSQLVITEAAAGAATAARQRVATLDLMTLLETTPESFEVANELLQAGALPAKAANDALHIGVSAAHAVQYLLTWNCRHLANATMRPIIEATCARLGLQAPIICTPEQLMEAL